MDQAFTKAQLLEFGAIAAMAGPLVIEGKLNLMKFVENVEVFQRGGKIVIEIDADYSLPNWQILWLVEQFLEKFCEEFRLLRMSIHLERV